MAGAPVMRAKKFNTVALNICGPFVRNLLGIIVLGSKILRWLLDFWEVCSPLP
jgi:hypothetical protein